MVDEPRLLKALDRENDLISEVQTLLCEYETEGHLSRKWAEKIIAVVRRSPDVSREKLK